VRRGGGRALRFVGAASGPAKAVNTIGPARQRLAAPDITWRSGLRFRSTMPPVLKQQVVGEHVRRLRVQAGVSVRTLARQSGFSPSFISQVENGQVSPSISSMEKIATAVGVSLGDFFGAVSGGEGGLIVRVADRHGLSSGWSNAKIEALNAPGSLARLEAMLITLRRGGRSGKHPYAHSREEFAFVMQGEVILTLGPHDHRLRRGDAATILPGELRLWRNEARTPARVMIIASPVGRSVPPGKRTRRRGRAREVSAAKRSKGAPSVPSDRRR
jgi:transcriptional regulator with XRE-family HTH domain